MDLEKETLIALIAAGASLFVASISLISSIYNSKVNIRNARSMELLKSKMALELEKRKKRNDILKSEIDSLKKAVSALQLLKDEIRVIKASASDSLEASVIMSSVSDCRNNVLDAYQDNLPNLSEKDSKAFHEAKNMAISTERYIGKLFEGKIQYVEAIMELDRIHSTLTDLQGILRDSQTEIVSMMQV